MATMFITLQGKGGVGKSFLTAAFAQWLVDRGRSVACIDTDTLNPTLLQYAPLQATHIRLSQNHVIDPRALDALVGIVTEAPADRMRRRRAREPWPCSMRRTCRSSCG